MISVTGTEPQRTLSSTLLLIYTHKKSLFGRRDLLPHEDSKNIESQTLSNKKILKLDNLQGDGDAGLGKLVDARHIEHTMVKRSGRACLLFFGLANHMKTNEAHIS